MRGRSSRDHWQHVLLRPLMTERGQQGERCFYLFNSVAAELKVYRSCKLESGHCVFIDADSTWRQSGVDIETGNWPKAYYGELSQCFSASSFNQSPIYSNPTAFANQTIGALIMGGGSFALPDSASTPRMSCWRHYYVSM